MYKGTYYSVPNKQASMHGVTKSSLLTKFKK